MGDEGAVDEALDSGWVPEVAILTRATVGACGNSVGMGD
jgi:hypothetical protein